MNAAVVSMAAAATTSMGALRATRRKVCLTSHFIPLTKNPSP